MVCVVSQLNGVPLGQIRSLLLDILGLSQKDVRHAFQDWVSDLFGSLCLSITCS